jgi:trk system potassium uptake protein
MSSKSVGNYRRKLNLHIVVNQERVTRIMQVLSFFVSLGTIASIVIYHGFYITLDVKEIIRTVVYTSMFFYIFKYFLLSFYSLNIKQYIKETWFEFIVINLLIINFLSFLIFPPKLNILEGNYSDYYLLLIQLFFLVIVTIELSKASTFLTKIHLSPSSLMLLSFLILISVGTLLLMLPRMTTHGISFIDALFTSTSATCVTGLSVINIGSDFTLKGQVVILLLIQLGGTSILTFATFFTTFFSGARTGLRYQHLVKDLLSTNKLSESYLLLREIVTASFFIEFAGALLFYMYWKNIGIFDSEGQTIFYSVFHAVSAFNNAGLSLWDANMMDSKVAFSYFPQTIIMILVILGGIGFVVISDFFNPQFIRERKKFKWKKLLPGTKIVLMTTFLILLIGTVIFYFLEKDISMAGRTTVFDKVFTSLFHVVVARTAGFNTINLANAAIPGMLLLIVIMFIGASPGSTGGGIKTTTFFVLIKSVLATIQGKKNIEFNKKTIPFELVDKSYSIVFMSLMIVILSVFTLSIVEPAFDLIDILFETVSAFATCGLSSGISPELSTAGKTVLIIDMYVGRVGTLTLAYALSKRVKETRHQYPDTYFMVG